MTGPAAKPTAVERVSRWAEMYMLPHLTLLVAGGFALYHAWQHQIAGMLVMMVVCVGTLGIASRRRSP